MKYLESFRVTAFSLLTLLIVGCTSTINTNYDSHFTEDGYYIPDTTITKFEVKQPSLVKFYVEVSGSMNGFFRSNISTHFKDDFWKILNYYSAISAPISTLKNSGAEGDKYALNEFQTKMNTGAFESSASTKVPVMLRTIINNLDTENGEVAVLVSDMKYSPVGSAAPNVLLSQYATDVSKVFADFGKTVSLIGATSNFFNSKKQEVCQESPYYYLILGNAENVVDVRNKISILLEQAGRFVDNIESGFNFGQPKYTFGTSNKCSQFENEPTFIEYQDETIGDTCTINLKVDLEDYRWLMANEACFRQSFYVKTLYGSEVKVGNVNISVENITGERHELNRKVTAIVELKIFGMANNSDVIEWGLNIPESNYSLFSRFFDEAYDENDPFKSYSLKDFVSGIFHGGIVSKDMKSNYILISKEK